MNMEQAITWALRIALIAIAGLLVMVGEPLLAILPFFVALGIEWRRFSTE